MALIDDVKALCDQLALLGWRDLLLAVTKQQLDILQANAAALKEEVQKPLTQIDTSFPGFEDFGSSKTRGITAGTPSRSLLYHALASPRVVRDGDGNLLRGFPTIPEIETVENLVFAIKPRTLAQIVSATGDTFATNGPFRSSSSRPNTGRRRTAPKAQMPTSPSRAPGSRGSARRGRNTCPTFAVSGLRTRTTRMLSGSSRSASPLGSPRP